MDELVEWSQGNPGAISFLMELIQPANMFIAIPIVQKLKASSIRGTDLYILHSDLCGKDMDKVKKLCEDCPMDILEDACSRQDYSGRELVAKYLQ